MPFLISTEVEAPLARAFASYESSHLRWNIHTLPQAFFFFSFIQTELYITATFALRACASELLFVKWNKKKKRGTEKRRSLRPHPRGRSDRLSVTRVCQQWRLRRSIAGCRVTVRLVPIQFVKFKHIWLSELWLVLLFYWNIGKHGKIRDCKEVFTNFTTYKKTYFTTSATPETEKIKNFRISPSPLIVSHLLFRNTRLKWITVTESQRPCSDTPAGSLTWIVGNRWLYLIVYTFLCTVKKYNVMQTSKCDAAWRAVLYDSVSIVKKQNKNSVKYLELWTCM